MAAELLGLPRSKVGVCVSVLPNQSAALVLDEASLCSLHKVPHDLKGKGFPCVVWPLHHAVPLSPRVEGKLVEESAFCCQAQAGHTPKPPFHHFTITATQDHHNVVVIRTQGLQAVHDLLIGSGPAALQVCEVAHVCAILTVYMPLVRG